MSFLSPLAFVFAAALPVVVVFYLLKRKRLVRVVPSTLLWKRFLAETQASAPFQRLRHNWLLFFQLLLLALAVLAIARPYFSGKTAQGKLQVVVLDASASMQSTDDKPSRFERARAEALRLVEGLDSGKGHRMMLLVAGANAEVKQSPTTEKAALRRALHSATVTDSPTRLVEALRVAETLTRDQPDSEVHLFSDGAVSDLGEFETRDLQLIFHRMGERANNAGIVTLDVKAHPEDPTRRAIFTSVANFAPSPVSATLDLLFDGALVDSRSIEVGPTNTTPVVFVAGQTHDGVFTVRLEAPDDLAVDNEASFLSLLPQPVKILLVSAGNRWLEKALLAANPRVELAKAADYSSASPPFDIVVLDNVAPTLWPAVNLLAFHVVRTNWFEGEIATLENPAVVDWKTTHPLLRFTSFDNVQIAQSFAVKTPPWAVSLLDAHQSSMIVAGDYGRQRLVWVGFEVTQSTWPLRMSFPIFVANAVDWLNPATALTEQYSIRAGEAFRLPLTEGATIARVTRPDGKELELPIDPKAREFVYGDTSRQGVYRLKWGTNQVSFVVNLLDAAESNTQPHEELQLGKRGGITATPLRRANLEYWRWFALAALAVMLFEWWWYHRRTA